MCFKKAVAKSSRFSRIFAFGLMIFSGAGLINLCTVCAETTDDLQGPPVAQSHIIGIDPGHQGPNVDMSDLEPLGPGSTEMKAKASTGTQGTFSGLPEYQLNLDVSLKLQQRKTQHHWRGCARKYQPPDRLHIQLALYC